MALEVSIRKRLSHFTLQADFQVDKVSMALFGPSGSGKSMLLKCIAGIEHPDSGRICLNGKILFDSDKKIDLPPQERRVGYLFQEYALFSHMTVLKNILAGMRNRSMTRLEKKEKVFSLLERYHMQGMAERYPSTLSGGECQRVAMLRMLAAEPDCILLDEPFSALDTQLKDDLLRDVKEMLDSVERPSIMVSHDERETEALCREIVRIENGMCGAVQPVRGEMNRIYLDSAATTLGKPDCVAKAMVAALTGMGNDGRGGHDAALCAGRTVYRARAAIASFFGAKDPSRVVFTANSTEALNIALRGTLRVGDHVLTSDAEHNSVLRPLFVLEKEGIGLSFLPLDDKGRIRTECLPELCRAETRAVVITHASNVTGNVTNLTAVSRFTKEHGLLLIVDASQTAGEMHMDMEKLGIDILCFTGHKGLMGPQGIGGMVVREGVDIRPLLYGGTGVQSFLHEQPETMPTRLEAGTLNGPGIAGLSAAIEWIQNTGIDEICTRVNMLARRFLDGVCVLPNVVLYGDLKADIRCPIVSLNIGNMDSAEVSDMLSERYGIAVRAGAHCAPLVHTHFGTETRGMVRFSFSYFTTIAEVDRAIEAVREIAREYGE